DDKHQVFISGELVKQGGLLKINSPSPSVLLRVYLTQQKQIPETRGPVPITGTITCPGASTLCLPQVPTTWLDTQRQGRLQIRDGDKVVWQGRQLPQNAPVTLRGRPHILTATPLSSQVRIELKEAKVASNAPTAR